MRFLLRLLLVLALGSYLWSHYGLFVRQRLLSVESGAIKNSCGGFQLLPRALSTASHHNRSPHLDYYRVAI